MHSSHLRRPIAVALAALCLAGSVHAATSADAADPPAPPNMPDMKALRDNIRELANMRVHEQVFAALDEEMSGLPASMAYVQSEFGHPREIVKNAPYTAEAVTESIQVLPDGNRIVRKSTSLLARDTAGRTRQERKDGGHAGVYIYDPMDGRSIVLNEQSRTAVRIPRMPSMPMPPEAPMAPMAPMPPTPPVGAAPPTPPTSGESRDIEVRPGRVVVKRRNAADGSKEEDVQVEVIRIGRGDADGAMPPATPLPPLTLPIVPRGKGETKSLGTRDFDGIKAEGTMVSHTIPAGQIGNERPIVVTTERWFSPDLFVVVYAKTSDPRAGETIYRLTNVKRG
jgi:hypothetical protein